MPSVGLLRSNPAFSSRFPPHRTHWPGHSFLTLVTFARGEIALGARNLCRRASRPLDRGGAGWVCVSERRVIMSRTQTKPMTNWCPQANPNEEGRCGTDKIADDGKRHHCDRPSAHADDLHACKCGVEWKHLM